MVECGEGLSAYGRTLKTVTSFKYMWMVFTVVYDNWRAVVGNLMTARKSWARLMRIMGREGSSPRVSGMLFKVVVQTVLIFRLETWVLTPRIGQALGRSQHRVTRWIIGRQPNILEEGGWE